MVLGCGLVLAIRRCAQFAGLGLFGWNGTGPRAAHHPGVADTDTNILFEDTTAVAIFDDDGVDPNASRRFKVRTTDVGGGRGLYATICLRHHRLYHQPSVYHGVGG